MSIPNDQGDWTGYYLIIHINKHGREGYTTAFVPKHVPPAAAKPRLHAAILVWLHQATVRPGTANEYDATWQAQCNSIYYLANNINAHGKNVISRIILHPK